MEQTNLSKIHLPHKERDESRWWKTNSTECNVCVRESMKAATVQPSVEKIYSFPLRNLQRSCPWTIISWRLPHQIYPIPRLLYSIDLTFHILLEYGSITCASLGSLWLSWRWRWSWRWSGASSSTAPWWSLARRRGSSWREAPSSSTPGAFHCLLS